jgi:D-alanine-D-alanine ligase
VARVDLLYGFDGGLYVLEVNTIPGFTPRSLLPMAAAEAGIPFAQLCDRVIRVAIGDAAGQRRRRLSA